MFNRLLPLLAIGFLMGSPSWAASETVMPVSLREAMQWTLEHHPQYGISKSAVDEARALLDEVRAADSPQLRFSASQARLTTNLQAQGFPANNPFFPSRLGPFNSLDARLTLTQTIFDRSLDRRVEASEAFVHAREHGEKALRDQLLTLAAMAYISAWQAEAHIDAQKAQLNESLRLADLAQDQKKAGVATGVDIARSQHRVNQDRFMLTQSETLFQEALIRLKRVMGIPMQTPIRLTTPLKEPRDLAPLDLQIQTALSSREELKVLEAQLISADATRRAAEAETLPTVGLQASAGPSGVSPTVGVYGTGMIGIGVTVPLMTGGLIQAHKAKAISQIEALQYQKQDVAYQIEEDVRVTDQERQAALSLKDSAKSGLALSERLYTLAEDRFKAGVADTFEVVDAATQLAMARSELIDANARAWFADVNEAAATGQIDQWLSE